MTFASIEAPRKRGAELTNETMVGDSKIAEFECKADEVGEKVRSVDAAVDKDCTVDIGV